MAIEFELKRGRTLH